MDTLLGDVPMEYAPPENFTWEPLPNRTYEYEFSISDQATREMMKFDSVKGITTQWVCPHSDPDCAPGDMDAGITFRVTDEAFAEEDTKVIEGQPIRYRVINES